MIIENKGYQVKVAVEKKQKITPFGGLFCLRLLMEKLGVDGLLMRGYGIKRRLRRFSESDYFRSVLALFFTGGQSVSDIGKLSADPVVRDIIGSDKGIPTDSAICKFFHSASEKSVDCFSESNLVLARTILSGIKRSGRSLGHTVYAFLDSSELEVCGDCFEGAGRNYDGDKALRLHALFLDDFLVGLQLNDIHHHTSYGWEGLLDNLDKAAESIDARIHVLLDSAYYNHKILQSIEAKGYFFSVTCKLCSSLEQEASIISDYFWENDYADFYYKPAGFRKPQRVVVRRQPIREPQADLFRKYIYYFVMTNSGGSPKEIIEMHSFKAGEENRLKELLADLGLHHPRFQSLNANRLYYNIAAMAYNLIKAAKYFLLDRTKYFFLGVRSFIYQFVLVAGRLVSHEWKQNLKFASYPLNLKFIEYRLAIIPTG